jgi:hypothetical protein
MNNILQYLVFVGAAVNLIGAIPYIKDTLKGKTKPNRVTWLMWTISPMIATFAAISNGVTWAVLPVFMAGFLPLLVLISSFINKDSYWKLEIFDYLCGFFSVLALILWAITKDPVIAITFSIISDSSAAMPTIIKAWKHPETETGSIYIISLLCTFTSFFAIKVWNFSSTAFPIYLIIISSIIIFSIYRKKIFKKKI